MLLCFKLNEKFWRSRAAGHLFRVIKRRMPEWKNSLKRRQILNDELSVSFVRSLLRRALKYSFLCVFYLVHLFCSSCCCSCRTLFCFILYIVTANELRQKPMALTRRTGGETQPDIHSFILFINTHISVIKLHPSKYKTHKLSSNIYYKIKKSFYYFHKTI